MIFRKPDTDDYRALLILISGIFTLIFVWGIGFFMFVASVNNSSPEHADIKTDAIVVLTGGAGRIQEGLTLLEQNMAKELFISGVDENVSKADLVADWKAQGFRKKLDCCVTIGKKARNTEQNATETKEWFETKNYESIRLVTSAYHIGRSLLEVKKELPDAIIVSHPVVAKELRKNKQHFWQIMRREYNKLLLTWLKNQLSFAKAEQE